jgi:hypothetical protein
MPLRFQSAWVTLELTEPALGTTPADYSTWDTWIRPRAPGPDVAAEEAGRHPVAGPRVHPTYTDLPAAKARARADRQAAAADEAAPDEAAPDRERLPKTTFFVDDQGRPLLWNYQILGHLKELGNIAKGAVAVKNLREKINRYVYVEPRQIPLDQPIVGELTRPLRAETARGPRIALATSDAVPAGTHLRFRVRVLDQGPKADVTLDLVRELLDLGQVRGIAQWRGGGFGTYRVVAWEPEA